MNFQIRIVRKIIHRFIIQLPYVIMNTNLIERIGFYGQYTGVFSKKKILQFDLFLVRYRYRFLIQFLISHRFFAVFVTANIIKLFAKSYLQERYR